MEEKCELFRHFLAHFPNILAYGLRNSTKKRGGEQKKKTLRGHDTLCERPDPLNTLGSVADYLRNSRFFRINDRKLSEVDSPKGLCSCLLSPHCLPTGERRATLPATHSVW